MDHYVRCELDDLHKQFAALNQEHLKLKSLMDTYKDIIDKIAAVDEVEKQKKHGIYIPLDDRIYMVKNKIQELMDADGCFRVSEIRRACRFHVGNYMIMMRKSGEIEQIKRGFYHVTSKFSSI